MKITDIFLLLTLEEFISSSFELSQMCITTRLSAQSQAACPSIALNSKGLIGHRTLNKDECTMFGVVLQDSLRCAVGLTASAN